MSVDDAETAGKGIVARSTRRLVNSATVKSSGLRKTTTPFSIEDERIWRYCSMRNCFLMGSVRDEGTLPLPLELLVDLDEKVDAWRVMIHLDVLATQSKLVDGEASVRLSSPFTEDVCMASMETRLNDLDKLSASNYHASSSCMRIPCARSCLFP